METWDHSKAEPSPGLGGREFIWESPPPCTPAEQKRPTREDRTALAGVLLWPTQGLHLPEKEASQNCRSTRGVLTSPGFGSREHRRPNARGAQDRPGRRLWPTPHQGVETRAPRHPPSPPTGEIRERLRVWEAGGGRDATCEAATSSSRRERRKVTHLTMPRSEVSLPW